jgi:MoaA/NifB/PqqE/SkfB family radical SAM enzyme
MSAFTPLVTYNGYSAKELKDLIAGRSLYIWGAGNLGRMINNVLKKNAFQTKAFCDSFPGFSEKFVDGVPVTDTSAVLDDVKQKKGFIIIGTREGKTGIEKECAANGLKKIDDFISYIQIPRQECHIDTSGKNPGEYMSAAVFEKLINKLAADAPFLVNVELAWWNDPLLNPDIGKIIKLAENHVLCAVPTPLQNIDHLEEAIKASPSRLRILTNGYGDSYEKNPPYPSWEKLLKNIETLKGLIQKYKATTQVSVLYSVYKNNNTADLENMRRLCKENGFNFMLDDGYLNPFDRILEHARQKTLDAESTKILNNIVWDVDFVMDLCKKESGNPCLCQRIFPVINWDSSVGLCHIFAEPKIVDNYLETSFADILAARHNQQHCRLCQQYGIHRLDINIFRARHPELTI